MRAFDALERLQPLQPFARRRRSPRMARQLVGQEEAALEQIRAGRTCVPYSRAGVLSDARRACSDPRALPRAAAGAADVIRTMRGTFVNDGIAAEQLVAADAGERDLHARLGDGLADEPGVHAVDRRLVHRARRSAAGRSRNSSRVTSARRVQRPELAREPLRERRFVAAAAELVEGERERVQRLAR